jgi:hypothetical protein
MLEPPRRCSSERRALPSACDTAGVHLPDEIILIIKLYFCVLDGRARAGGGAAAATSSSTSTPHTRSSPCMADQDHASLSIAVTLCGIFKANFPVSRESVRAPRSEEEQYVLTLACLAAQTPLVQIRKLHKLSWQSELRHVA